MPRGRAGQSAGCSAHRCPLPLAKRTLVSPAAAKVTASAGTYDVRPISTTALLWFLRAKHSSCSMSSLGYVLASGLQSLRPQGMFSLQLVSVSPLASSLTWTPTLFPYRKPSSRSYSNFLMNGSIANVPRIGILQAWLENFFGLPALCSQADFSSIEFSPPKGGPVHAQPQYIWMPASRPTSTGGGPPSYPPTVSRFWTTSQPPSSAWTLPAQAGSEALPVLPVSITTQANGSLAHPPGPTGRAHLHI